MNRITVLEIQYNFYIRSKQFVYGKEISKR
jgi:hypothetical protein